MTWLVRTQETHVTLFNPLNGSRVSFGPTPERLRAPELLDVKLTDVCSVGCAYCYQDSRPDRGHARLEDVAFIATEAGKARVFEVALGGGEVSEYPHFHETLHLFREAGVKPNFTTRRMRWLSRHWPEFRELVGGVAVSVNTAPEVRLLNSLIPAPERREGQLVVQVVMGTIERPELLKLVQEAGAAGIRVTLLGFKDVGRGQQFKPLNYGWWLDDLSKYVLHAQISIDTALASETPEKLAAMLLPGSYHTEEGRFSAYVDAVKMTLAPSSYHNGPAHTFDADWLDAFASADFVQGPRTPKVKVPPHAPSRIRLGFATNSSSSHSLVLLKEPIQDEPPLSERQEWVDTVGSWGSFVLVSREAKQHYLAANLVRAAESLFPDTLWSETQRRIQYLCDLSEDTDLSGYDVDHQSAMWFQKHPQGIGPHPGEFERVKAVLLADNVAVFGESEEQELTTEHQNRVLLGLDGASFVMMGQTPEKQETPRTKHSDEDSRLYLLELDRGKRFRYIVESALQAGLTWEDVALALHLSVTEKSAHKAHQAQQKLISALKLSIPSHINLNPNQRQDWLGMFVWNDEDVVNSFVAKWKSLRKYSPNFADILWGFVASKARSLPEVLQALRDPEAFIKATGTEPRGCYVRIEEYLRNLSISP